MLDVARAVVLIVALIGATRHRAWATAAFLAVTAGLLTLVGVAAYHALARHEVSGEYGFAFVYVGATMLPLGDRPWMPLAVQLALAGLTLVPALLALRNPARPGMAPVLLVFVPNAMLAVLTSLSAFLMWRQVRTLPEYWDNPSLAGAGRPSYARVTLRPGRDEQRMGSRRTDAPTVRVRLVNRTGDDVWLVWLDFDGRRQVHQPVTPGAQFEEEGRPGYAYLVTTRQGDALCAFAVGGGDAVAEVEGECR